MRAQESRLVPALIGCFGPTIGLFIFAWTARPGIHWIAPTIGITIYGASVFVVMQCIFVYGKSLQRIQPHSLADMTDTLIVALCVVQLRPLYKANADTLIVPLSYPQYAASLFAGNDFFRSALACGSILFARPLFINLGVARGTTLLAGLSVIGIIGIFILWKFGAKLRARSKFAIA